MLTRYAAITPAERLRYQNLPEVLSEAELTWKRDYIAREKIEEDAREYEADDIYGCEDMEYFP